MRGKNLRDLVDRLHGYDEVVYSIAKGIPGMNAPVLGNTCNIALVFANEQLLRRNNIRAKLASRGFVVRKEIQSDARSFSFRSADLVVVIADNLGPGATKLVKQAAEHEKVEVVFLPHQTSRPEWQALDRFVPAALLPSVPALRATEAEDDREELLRIYEAERDRERDARKSAEEERDAAVADRQRLGAELADARGKLRSTEAGAVRGKQEMQEAYRRDSEERDKRLELLGGQNARLTEERDGARDQAAKYARERAQLVADRDAARRKLVEMAAEAASGPRTSTDDAETGRLRRDLQDARANAEALRAQVNALTEDRDSYLNRFNMAHAREKQRQDQLAEARSALDELRRASAQAAEEAPVVKELRTAKRSLSHLNGNLEKRNAKLQARIDELEAAGATGGAPAVAVDGGVAEIARMISGLVTAGLLSEAEAYAKLAAACGKGRS